MCNPVCECQKISYRDTVLVIGTYSDTARKFHVNEYVYWAIPFRDTTMIYYGFKGPTIKKDTLYTGYDNKVYWGYFYSVREWHTNREGQSDRELTKLYINGDYVFAKNEYWVHLYYLGVNKLPLPKSMIVWQSIGN